MINPTEKNNLLNYSTDLQDVIKTQYHISHQTQPEVISSKYKNKFSKASMYYLLHMKSGPDVHHDVVRV